MSTTIKDLVCHALLKLSNTIYSPYAITISNYIYKLESDLSVSKKTEEKAVGDLGAAGLELAAVVKERDGLRLKIAEMEQKAQPAPVVLPKEIAAALDEYLAKSPFNDDKAYIAWRVLQHNDPSGGFPFLSKLQQYAAGRGGSIKLVDAIRYGYTAEQPEKTPDDHIFEQYVQFCDNGMVDAAEAMLKAIEILAPGKTDLLEKMRAVERLPF
ncbi:hypothetical protein [Paenibacillus sp. MMO-58]|uniref:hypothetical protein n=1 Tax=Paenibacillus sp. MMO-58 TaxID=3081290 RepID=UPI0030173EB4